MDLISEFVNGIRNFGIWTSPQKFGNQYPVRTRQEIVNYLSKYNGVFNCGISVCEYVGGIPYLLYLPFDFDSDSLDKSWNDAYRFYNYMIDEEYAISLNFSGFKGFHCLIPVEYQLYSKKQIRNVQRYYKELFDLKTCDANIFGDIRRLIRIPGTLHTGKFKRIKGKGWVRIGEGGYCDTICESEGKRLNLNEIYTPEYPDFEFESETNGEMNNLHDYPCIESTMDLREPPQLIRYSYVAYWLLKGKGPEEIIQSLEDRHSDGKKYEWDDWDLDYTTYQVYQIANNGSYKPLSCKAIRSMGLCIECPHSIENWFKQRKKDIK